MGSLQLPAAKGPPSQQLKSRVVSVQLLEWHVSAWAAASPLTQRISKQQAEDSSKLTFEFYCL